MNEDTSNQPPDDFKKFTDFLLKVTFRATNDLRKHLKIDEKSFRFVAPCALARPKDAYLYRILDEVQKAGVSIQLWREYLSDTKRDEKVPGQLERVLFESVVDDQSYRARKLVEALVELICFSDTDQEIYYRDFFLLRDLHLSVESQRDRREFFAFESANTAFRSYRIRYLNTPPIPSIKEDWFAAGQIRLFLPRKRAESLLDRMVSGSELPEADRVRLISLIPKDRGEALIDFVKTAWKVRHQVREAMKLSKPPSPQSSAS
jgi:hypothetical protein